MATSTVKLDSNNNICSDCNQDEIKAFTSYFELLSQIDNRLQNEDPEYRATYYPES